MTAYRKPGIEDKGTLFGYPVQDFTLEVSSGGLVAKRGEFKVRLEVAGASKREPLTATRQALMRQNQDLAGLMRELHGHKRKTLAEQEARMTRIDEGIQELLKLAQYAATVFDVRDPK